MGSSYFEEHQRCGSSLGLPSNFGMSKGSFLGIEGQCGECKMGLFIKHDKSGNSKFLKNGSFWFGYEYW